MKIIRHSILCLSFLCCCLSWAMAGETGKKPQKLKEHFYYALPENYFTITLTVNKTTTFKAPLADYAGKVTGLSSVVKENTSFYTMEDIKLDIHSRMDTQHVYYVETLKRNMLYHRFYRRLSLNNYTSLMQNNETNQQLSTTEHPAGLFVQNRFSIYTADAMMETYDTTYINQYIDDTLVGQIPQITKRLVVKPSQQQAQEAIKIIEEIREARWLLISGDHETDFSQLELMLEQLNQKENEYLDLFRGKTETEKLTYTFVVTPTEKGDNLSIPVFYFSGTHGVVDKEENIFTYECKLQFNRTNIQNITNQAKKNFLDKQPEKKKKNSVVNFYYRNPQYYNVSLYSGQNVVKDFGIYPVSQFGETINLPANVRTCKIDPLTGALLYLETTK